MGWFTGVQQMSLDAELEVEPALLPPPFGSDRYVPAVLTRQGERLAVRELPEEVRRGMTPLFVVHPIDNKPGTDEPVEDALPVRANADLRVGARLRDWKLSASPRDDGPEREQTWIRVSGDLGCRAISVPTAVSAAVCTRSGRDERQAVN
jgi:Beta protein